MHRKQVERITRSGLLLALVTLLTAYVRVPLPAGYAHVGDGAVMLCGLMLGPFGALPAAAGTVIADFLSGFPFYAPFSAVVKGFMAYAAGRWLCPEARLSRANLWKMALFFLAVPVGYFPADWIAYGFDAALLAVIGNVLQALVGYVVSLFLLSSGLPSARY